MSRVIWDTLAACGQCSRAVLASFETPDNNPPTKWLGNSQRRRLQYLQIFPQRPPVAAPHHTPENAARFFRQGMDNLLGRNCDAAGAMFRKALETALKSRFPKIGVSVSLYQRIEKAAEQHALTPELAEWAQQIRLDGNAAVHGEEPFSQEDAMRLCSFTKLVFQYLFTLPGMLAEARGEPERDADQE